MAPRIPLVVPLAGPNGAGKSTGAAHLLRGAMSVEEFVNADTIAQGLSAYRPEAAAIAAGRVMLERLRFLARERRDFAFEATLAGRGRARWLDLQSSGYRRMVASNGCSPRTSRRRWVPRATRRTGWALIQSWPALPRPRRRQRRAPSRVRLRRAHLQVSFW